MPRKHLLPSVSDTTIARLMAEKAGQEANLERGLQLNLGVIFSEIIRTGTSRQLDRAEAGIRKRREQWFQDFTCEQPAFFEYMGRVSSDKMADVFRIFLKRVHTLDEETVTMLATNFGNIVNGQILDLVYMLYEGLYAETEAQNLTHLWDAPEEAGTEP